MSIFRNYLLESDDEDKCPKCKSNPCKCKELEEKKAEESKKAEEKEEVEESAIEFIEESYIEEPIVLDEGVLVMSSQGKILKKKIKDIIKENTDKFGVGDALKAFLFGYSYAIKKSSVEAVTKGIDKLFDAVWMSDPYMYLTDYNVAYYIGIKGGYLYKFRINFAHNRSQMVWLSFNETKLDKIKIPKEAIEMTLKNASSRNYLDIGKNYIRCIASRGGKFDPNYVDEALYNKIQKAFPDQCRYDKTMQCIKF